MVEPQAQRYIGKLHSINPTKESGLNICINMQLFSPDPVRPRSDPVPLGGGCCSGLDPTAICV